MSSFQQMSNPYRHNAHKTLKELMGDKYKFHFEIADRIGERLVTEKDYREFMKFVLELYELGYVKAVHEHKNILESQGYKVKIKGSTVETQSVPKIFPNQKNQDDG